MRSLPSSRQKRRIVDPPPAASGPHPIQKQAVMLCLFSMLIVWAGMGTGCARRTHHIRTETMVQQPATPVVVEQHTLRTETIERQPQGVLSSLVHVVGEIIALPFRLVGLF
ncbi:MAG: hypothetical protein HYT88_04550 [Candidatus Omnitrophica bacterium]|nr:hypothetical protein [Candidatus Omnitrophota bacterium]